MKFIKYVLIGIFLIFSIAARAQLHGYGGVSILDKSGKQTYVPICEPTYIYEARDGTTEWILDVNANERILSPWTFNTSMGNACGFFKEIENFNQTYLRMSVSICNVVKVYEANGIAYGITVFDERRVQFIEDYATVVNDILCATIDSDPLVDWYVNNVEENNDTLQVVRNDGTTWLIDFKKYLDNTNLPRITSGAVNGNCEIVLTRDDATTVTIPLGDCAGSGDDDQIIEIFEVIGDQICLHLSGDAQDTICVDIADFDTDDQYFDQLTFDGVNLCMSLDGDNLPAQCIDISGLNTDDQTILDFSFDDNTGIISLDLEGDSLGAFTIDISNLAPDGGGIDSLYFHQDSLICISIEGDDVPPICVSIEGLDTDDQAPDQFQIIDNILYLSLEDDGVGPFTVDLSDYIDGDSGTDDQVIDFFDFNCDSGILRIHVEDDPDTLGVDLSCAVGGGGSLTITDGVSSQEVVLADDEILFDGIDLISVSVGAVDKVSIGIDGTGANTGQVITWDGNNPVWDDSAGGVGHLLFGESGTYQNIEPGDTMTITGANLITTQSQSIDNLVVSIDPTGAPEGSSVTYTTASGVHWSTSGSTDHDWYQENSQDVPTSILQDIWTLGNVAIGDSTDSGQDLKIKDTDVSVWLQGTDAGITFGEVNNQWQIEYLNVNGDFHIFDQKNTGSFKISSGFTRVFDLNTSSPVGQAKDQGGQIILDSYKNTRDDSSTDTPINFLYTDASGRMLSSDVSIISEGNPQYLEYEVYCPDTLLILTLSGDTTPIDSIDLGCLVGGLSDDWGAGTFVIDAENGTFQVIGQDDTLKITAYPDLVLETEVYAGDSIQIRVVPGANNTVLTTDGTGAVVWDSTALDDHDWYEVGASTAPDNINDNQFTRGTVGINIASPQDTLHLGVTDGGLTIEASGTGQITFENATNDWYFQHSAANMDIRPSTAGGNFVVSKSDGSDKLTVVTNTGDIRFHDYPNTRNDPGDAINFLYTSSDGTVQSDSIINLIGDFSYGTFAIDADNGVTDSIDLETPDEMYFKGRDILTATIISPDTVYYQIDPSTASVGDIVRWDGKNVVWDIDSTGSGGEAYSFFAKGNLSNTHTINNGQTLDIRGTDQIVTKGTTANIIEVYIDTSNADAGEVLTYNGNEIIWDTSGDDNWGAESWSFLGNYTASALQKIDADQTVYINGSNLIGARSESFDSLDIFIDVANAIQGQYIYFDGTSVVWDSVAIPQAVTDADWFEYDGGFLLTPPESINDDQYTNGKVGINGFDAGYELYVGGGGGTSKVRIDGGTAFSQLLFGGEASGWFQSYTQSLGNLVFYQPTDAGKFMVSGTANEWFSVNLPEGNIKIEGYPNTRDDGIAVENFLYTDEFGNLLSAPKDSIGDLVGDGWGLDSFTISGDAVGSVTQTIEAGNEIDFIGDNVIYTSASATDDLHIGIIDGPGSGYVVTYDGNDVVWAQNPVATLSTLVSGDGGNTFNIIESTTVDFLGQNLISILSIDGGGTDTMVVQLVNGAADQIIQMDGTGSFAEWVDASEINDDWGSGYWVFDGTYSGTVEQQVFSTDSVVFDGQQLIYTLAKGVDELEVGIDTTGSGSFNFPVITVIGGNAQWYDLDTTSGGGGSYLYWDVYADNSTPSPTARIQPQEKLYFNGQGVIETEVVNAGDPDSLNISITNGNNGDVLLTNGSTVEWGPSPAIDYDWHESGTLTAPDAIGDNMFTEGKATIGADVTGADLYIYQTNDVADIDIHSNTGNAELIVNGWELVAANGGNITLDDVGGNNAFIIEAGSGDISFFTASGNMKWENYPAARDDSSTDNGAGIFAPQSFVYTDTDGDVMVAPFAAAGHHFFVTDGTNTETVELYNTAQDQVYFDGLNLINAIVSGANENEVNYYIDSTGATADQVIMFKDGVVKWANQASGADNWGNGNFGVNADSGGPYTIGQDSVLNVVGANIVETVLSAGTDVDLTVKLSNAPADSMIVLYSTAAGEPHWANIPTGGGDNWGSGNWSFNGIDDATGTDDIEQGDVLNVDGENVIYANNTTDNELEIGIIDGSPGQLIQMVSGSPQWSDANEYYDTLTFTGTYSSTPQEVLDGDVMVVAGRFPIRAESKDQDSLIIDLQPGGLNTHLITDGSGNLSWVSNIANFSFNIIDNDGSSEPIEHLDKLTVNGNNLINTNITFVDADDVKLTVEIDPQGKPEDYVIAIDGGVPVWTDINDIIDTYDYYLRWNFTGNGAGSQTVYVESTQYVDINGSNKINVQSVSDVGTALYAHDLNISIDADGEPDGFVLTADGAGNVDWEAIPPSIFSFNVNGVDAGAGFNIENGETVNIDGIGLLRAVDVPASNRVDISLINGLAGQIIQTDGVNATWDYFYLQDLEDVDSGINPSNNDVLIWNDSNSQWEAGPINPSYTFSILGDRIGSASDAIENGTVLLIRADGNAENVADFSTGFFANTADFQFINNSVNEVMYTQAGGDVVWDLLDLWQLGDVDDSAAAPNTTNDVLQWNGSAWIPASIPGDGWGTDIFQVQGFNNGSSLGVSDMNVNDILRIYDDNSIATSNNLITIEFTDAGAFTDVEIGIQPSGTNNQFIKTTGTTAGWATLQFSDIDKICGGAATASTDELLIWSGDWCNAGLSTILSADNGLTPSGVNNMLIKLGGPLTQNTDISGAGIHNMQFSNIEDFNIISAATYNLTATGQAQATVGGSSFWNLTAGIASIGRGALEFTVGSSAQWGYVNTATTFGQVSSTGYLIDIGPGHNLYLDDVAGEQAGYVLQLVNGSGLVQWADPATIGGAGTTYAAGNGMTLDASHDPDQFDLGGVLTETVTTLTLQAGNSLNVTNGASNFGMFLDNQNNTVDIISAGGGDLSLTGTTANLSAGASYLGVTSSGLIDINSSNIVDINGVDLDADFSNSADIFASDDISIVALDHLNLNGVSSATFSSGGLLNITGGGGVNMSATANSNVVISTNTGYISIDGTDLRLINLPTSDPSVAGQLWNDGGVLKVSAG